MFKRIGGVLGAAGWGGISNYVWLGLGVFIIGAFAAIVLIGRHAVDETLTRTAKQGEAVGAQGAVIAGQNQTLDQLKDAKDAEATLRADGERSATRHAECMRNNRRKSACERYKPDAGE